MQHSNYIKRLSDAADVKIFILAVLFGSFGLNLILAATVMSWPKTQRTVFLPLEINKSFWVDGDQISPHYLEMMGVHVLQLMLNVTPNSINYQGNLLLGITDPRAHPEIKKRINITSSKLKRDSISTFFQADEVFKDAKHPMRISWAGTEITMLSDKRVKEMRKIYFVEFATVAGKTVVSKFGEATEKDPLGIADKKKSADVNEEEI